MRYPHACLRCGNAWNAYVPKPEQCPSCKSQAWAVPANLRLMCPAARCGFKAKGPFARRDLMAHVMQATGQGHGDKFKRPGRFEALVRSSTRLRQLVA